MKIRRFAHPVLAALVIALGANATALAADQASCRVLEIKASKEGNTVDPALAPIAKKLEQAPFDSWKSFKLLAKHDLRVERMKAHEQSLQPGGKLEILYRDRLSAAGKKDRLRLTLTLDDKTGKRVAALTLQLDSGDYNLMGGGRLDDGSAYILGTTCSVK